MHFRQKTKTETKSKSAAIDYGVGYFIFMGSHYVSVQSSWVTCATQW